MNLELTISVLGVVNSIVCLVLFALVIILNLQTKKPTKLLSYWVLAILSLLNLALLFDYNVERFALLLSLCLLIYLFYKQFYTINLRSNKLEQVDSTMQIIQAKEQERSRIYANLHDDVGAKLLELIYTAKDDASKKIAKDVLKKMRQAVASTENIQCDVEQLVDSILEESKLRISSTKLILKQNINIENPNKSLPTTVPMTVLRVLREVLSNIIKHSQANQIDIDIKSDEGKLMVLFKDNGVGFNISSSKGKGMQTIQKRADSISAEINFESQKGKGSRFELRYNYERK